MAIVRVKTGTAATTTGTGTVTPTLPSGATAGNVIVALVACNSPTTPPTFNSGGGATKQVENATGNACCTAIFTKVAAGGETNIGAFTLSTGTRDVYGILLEYSGLSGITDQQSNHTGNATGVTVIPTSVTAGSATAPSLVLGIEAHINALQSATVARAAGDASTGGTITKVGEAASGAATAAQRVCARVSEVLITGSGVVGHQATVTTARAYSAAISSFQEAAGGTNATATPSVVAAVASVPAPTVIASSPNATVSASTVGVVASVPTPSVITGIGEPIPGTDTAGLTNDGTANWGNSPDRVLWWNSYQSRWDAVLPLTAPPAAGQSDWWIVANAAGTTTNKVLADARSGARPTTVWDDANKRLYVLMEAVGGQGGSLISAFDYNSAADTYTVDSSVNAVNTGLVGMGGDSNTALTRTPNGYLWVACSRGGAGIVVNRSTNSGATWGTPLSLKATQADGKLALSYFTNGGTTYVCVANGENGIAAVPGPAKYNFLYIDSTSSGWGTAGNWTDDSANIPALSSALIAADDETCLARDASENVYWITETENLGSATSADEQWLLYKRTPSGTWSKVAIHKYDGQPSRKRPTVTIDDTNSAIYVFANTDSDTNIVYRTAALSNLSALASAGDTTLFSVSGKGHRNTHPPERVTGPTDLLVLCDQQTDDYVVRNLLAIAGGGNATATPSTVTAVAAVPAPNEQAAAKPTPSVVVAVAAVPAPTLRSHQIATPATVVATAVVPAPTVLAAARPTPATVVSVAAVPSSTIRGTAVVQPAPVAAVGGLQTPAIVVAGDAAVPASTIVAVAAVPALTLRSHQTVVPATVVGVSAVPAPTLRSDQTFAVGAVVATAAVPAPSAQGAARPSPATVTSVAALPVPTVQANAIPGVSTVPTVAGLQTPSILVGGNATANPSTVVAVAVVPASTVSGTARTAPSTVVAVTATPTPTLGVSASASVVVTISAVPAPTVRGTAIVAPATVAAVASVPTPAVAIAGNASVPASTVLAVAASPAPTTQGAAKPTPGAVQGLVSVAFPVLTSDRAVGALTVVATGAIPVPVVRGTAVVQPSTVPTVAIPQPASVLAGGSVTVGASTVTAFAGVAAPTARADGKTAPSTVIGIAAVPAPILRGTALVSAPTVVVVVTVPSVIVFGGSIGVPVKGPTRKRNLEVSNEIVPLTWGNATSKPAKENQVLEPAGAPRAVPVGAGSNSTEAI